MPEREYLHIPNRIMNTRQLAPVLGKLAGTDAAILVGGKFVMEPRVKPGGILKAASFNRSLRRREKTPVSEFGGREEFKGRGIFTGYKIYSDITPELSGICRDGAVYVCNYPAEKGPYNTLWSSFFSSAEVKNATGKEIAWIQSYVDNYNSNPFTAKWHEIVADSIGAIHGLEDVRQKLREQQIVGVYPEGEESLELKRAIPQAAVPILVAARADKPLIVAAIWKEGDSFNMRHQIVESSEVLEVHKSMKGLGNHYQEIADYVMRIIADLMPQHLGHLRGVYR